MNVELWPQLVAASFSLGALYMLVGLSWVVIFRTTKVLNFASGEVAIAGAYIFYVLSEYVHLPFAVAMPAAIAVAAALGAGIYLVFIRPLAGRPLWSPVVLTMGLAFVMDSFMSMCCGRTIFLDPPFGSFTVQLPLGAGMNSRDLLSIGSGVIAFAGVLLFLRLSRTGAAMRAAAEHPLLASQRGLNINVLFALGWALSAAVAATAGIPYVISTALLPSAVSIGILALAPALLGGLDSVEGVLIGAFIAALVTNAASVYIGPHAIDATAALVVLLVLYFRPYGLFGTRSPERV